MGWTLRVAQETLDHPTNPVVTEVWTLRSREQRLCCVGTDWCSGLLSLAPEPLKGREEARQECRGWPCALQVSGLPGEQETS